MTATYAISLAMLAFIALGERWVALVFLLTVAVVAVANGWGRR